MVIGNGLVAKAFVRYEHDKDVLIFASGVSNSSEQKTENFNREFKLLKDQVHEKKLLIYFTEIVIKFCSPSFCFSFYYFVSSIF